MEPITLSRCPLRINDRCDVYWQMGDVYVPAVIVERRAVGSRKCLGEQDIKGSPGDYEYYIHYIDHDHRSDEWVSFDLFKLETLQRDNETTLTRSRTAAFEHKKRTQETTPVKNIDSIVIGKWELQAWYYSPFPYDYSDAETVYFCEYCLEYMKLPEALQKHERECHCRYPPGKQIYRENDLAVYEIDGKDGKSSNTYCQNLSLMAMLFLKDKTVGYDVARFYFYVVTKFDIEGAHLVGYFSKQKKSKEGNNLSCIMTLPQFQKAGYGKFMISLSYELTKLEGKVGSPERPLSGLGKAAYQSYWKHALTNALATYDAKAKVTKTNLSEQTGIAMEDIISTLQDLEMIKCSKGTRQEPQDHVILVMQDVIKKNKPLSLCKKEYLNWTPPSDQNNG